MKKKIFVMMGMVLTIATIHGVDKTTVTNSTDHLISVYFQAYGCALPIEEENVSRPISFLCKKVIDVEKGGSATFDWKWGQADRTVYVMDTSWEFENKGDMKQAYNWTGFTLEKRSQRKAGVRQPIGEQAAAEVAVPKSDDFELRN